MKNKIIALFLVVVMATLALASCSKSYSYAEENLDDYLYIEGGFEAFEKKLMEISVKEGTIASAESVEESIWSSLASYAEKNGEKKTDGKLDLNDTLYYAFYITYEKDGKTYAYNVDEYMKETSSPKNSIKLSAIDVNDENADDTLSVEIKKALAALAQDGEVAFSGYKTVTTKEPETAVTKDAFKSIIVSYNRTEKNADGTDGQKSTANAVVLDLNATGDSLDAKLAMAILGAENKVTIGNAVQFYTGTEGDKKQYVGTTEITAADGKKYVYSDINVICAVENWGMAVDSEGKEVITIKDIPVGAKVELSVSSSSKDKIDSLHNEGDSVTIPADAKVTYHIFPVYYYDVSEIDARSILLEVLGSAITATSLEVFSDEGYKNADKTKTLKALVEELVADYKENTSSKISTLKTALETAEKAEKAAKEKYDAAKVKADKTDATEDEKKAAEDAKKIYDEAVGATKKADEAYTKAKNAAATKIDEILKVTKEGDDKGISAVIIEQYKESKLHTMKDEYNEAMVKKIAAEIWTLIQKEVKVIDNNKYPEKLLKEAKEQIYDNYEYNYYHGTMSSTDSGTSSTDKESIYSYYEDKGRFEGYIIKETGAANIDGVDAKIEEQAKKNVLPIMQVYFVAKKLEAKAEAAMPAQITENKFAYLESDGSEGDILRDAEFFANNFYIDDETFKDYKKLVGNKSAFESNMDYFGGETAYRAAMQFNNLFDYLLMTRRAESSEGGHSHVEIQYATKDGKQYLDFYNIGYTIKE